MSGGALVYRFCVPDCILCRESAFYSYIIAVSVLILVWIGGFVKEAVFDLVLSCNSLFSGIMEDCL